MPTMVCKKEEKNNLVLYHGNCPDGFGAAWAAYQALGSTASYHPVHYSEDVEVLLEMATGKDVYVLDFCFSRDVLTRLNAVATSLLVLDHHLSSYELVKDLPFVAFNMEKSGAKLSWEYFNPHRTPPDLVNYIEDRDLWLWRLPDAKAITRVYDTVPMNFDAWDALSELESSSLVEKGELLHAEDVRFCEMLLATASPIEIAGATGLIANGPSFLNSLLGHMLAVKSGSFGIVWREESGIYKTSWRSVNIDLIPLAGLYGGGGHPFACGAVLSSDQLSHLMSLRTTR